MSFKVFYFLDLLKTPLLILSLFCLFMNLWILYLCSGIFVVLLGLCMLISFLCSFPLSVGYMNVTKYFF